MPAQLIRRLDKCLKTQLRHGPAPDNQRTYFLPYSGNLTTRKLDSLAEVFANNVASLFAPNFTKQQVQVALRRRLESEWYTGREKNVAFSKYESGRLLIEGEGWFMSSFPQDDIVIVEEKQ